MNDQTDNSQKEPTEEQESSKQLPEEMAKQFVKSKQELAEIEEFLKQLPEELLASVLSEKIQQEEPSGVIKVVKAVSQQFSGPIPPLQV